MRPLEYTMTLKNWYKILVGIFFSFEDPSFFEDIEKIQREMCNIEGNLMYFIFDRNNLVELNELLHDAYFNNNEYNHNSQFKMSNFLKSYKTLVFPPMFQIVKW